MNTTKQAVYDQQKKWATDHSIPTDADGYTRTVEENLFQPLSAETRTEFAAGGGDELGGTGKRGKMQAMHSSSALVCNVFDYWRNRPMTFLLEALGALAAAEHLHFEQTYPTGVSRFPPQPDIALIGDGTKPFVIESKFAEPYGADKSGIVFKTAYFPEGDGLWEQHNLLNSQALAEKIDKREVKFSRLSRVS